MLPNLLCRSRCRNLLRHTRQFRIVTVVALFAVSAITFSGCADSTEPSETPGPGRFTLNLSGSTTLDLEGTAFPTPSPANGLLQEIRMIAVNPSRGYTLIIEFAPPMTIVEGSRPVAPTSSTKATFTIFDRGAGKYLEIASAQAGTLTTDQCTLWLRCPGTFTGQFLMSDSTPATITASFDARLTTQ